MPRNVLLMLSTDQPPPPDEEVRWHAAECRRATATALVTTRRLTGLVPHKSVVAFYGNAALGNRYLGRGTYVDFVRLDSPWGRELLSEHPLYARHGIPAGAKGFLLLRDVEVAHEDEGLEALAGTIEASGLPLALEHIPRGAARAQVYYG